MITSWYLCFITLVIDAATVVSKFGNAGADWPGFAIDITAPSQRARAALTQVGGTDNAPSEAARPALASVSGRVGGRTSALKGANDDDIALAALPFNRRDSPDMDAGRAASASSASGSAAVNCDRVLRALAPAA